MIKNVISFYRDCFLAENSRTVIDTIFGAHIEYRCFIKDQERLTNHLLNRIPLEIEYARNLAKAAELYRKEKSVYYFSFLLMGMRYSEEGQKDFFCAPLILQKSQVVEEQGQYWLQPEQGGWIINDYWLQNFSGQETYDTSFYDMMARYLDDSVAVCPSVSEMTIHLKRAVPEMDCSDLVLFPKLFDEKKLKSVIQSIRKSEDERIKIVPCSLMALMKKLDEGRGVLDELGTIIQAEAYSPPLVELFDEHSAPAPPADAGRGWVPGILSRAQENVLISASQAHNTLVIGPPGSGKSFTIAALAMEHFSKGKTVLIASQKDHAVDVVADKIEQQLQIAGCVVRGGKSDYLRDLKQFLQNLLNGMYADDSVNDAMIRSLSQEVYGQQQRLRSLQNQLVRESKKLIQNGQFLADDGDSFFRNVKRWLIFQGAKRGTPLWEIYEQYETQLETNVKTVRDLLSKSYILRLNKALTTHRKTINTFLKAVRSRTGGRQEDLFSTIDFTLLLSIFPVWLVNLRDIYKVLPLCRNLFDLAILDEATQCDIASCIPLLYRARRAVITGDPNQLRHISFLSKSKQYDLRANNQLTGQEKHDYRTKSILDYCSDILSRQENVIFLNEHYRSQPQIIAFSNQTFYGGKLSLMTEKPLDYPLKPVSLCYCQGRRDSDGVNREEAHTIIGEVLNIVCHHEGGLHPTIGILSPFRKQADYIMEILQQQEDFHKFQAHKLLVGTAHSFQGEERDIMLLSWVIDDQSHSGCLRFLEKPDVFNVTVTRARRQQRIFYSFDIHNLNKESILWKYLSFIRTYEGTRGKKHNQNHDDFANEVSECLRNRGIKTLIGESVAGLTMDVAAISNQQCIGIDLVGYPGDFAGIYSLDRYRMFKRAGLSIIPLPYVNWIVDNDGCIEYLTKRIKSPAL